MSGPLNKPQAQAPIGFVTIDGVKYPVVINAPSWYRYLTVELYERAGGADGSGTTDLAISAFEDAGIQEQLSLIYAIGDAGRQNPPLAPEARIEHLETQVAALLSIVGEMDRTISGLQQGVSL